MKNKQEFIIKLFKGMSEVVGERYKTQQTPNFNELDER